MSFFLVNGANAFYREEGFSYNTYYDAEYGLVYQSAQISEYTSGIAVSGTATQTTTAYCFAYDENGNITEITDSEGTVQRKYYYDDLGQLIREDNRSLNKTYVWTYDDAGNILTKKTYAFTTGTLGSVQGTQSYTYGNST